MAINLTVPKNVTELKPRITVIGVGGAGGNAVNNMIRSQLEGVEFVVANTDSQALAQSLTDRRIQLGPSVTEGLGAGSRPEVGRAAAEETMEDILQYLRGSNMVFITGGMGGGTGTGAAPVIARAARENGILTVGVVTKPFSFEGAHRMRMAESGIEQLQQYVDTLIIIPNQNLFRIANERTTFADAFKMADDVLYSGVRGVTDLMVMPGLINLDFADIRTVMSEMGKAMMGTGEAEGEKRAIDAAEAAISNPLLEDASMKGARGVLINITGGPDMTLFEVDEAANRIRDEVDSDANIIFGSTFDPSLEGRMRVSVVATGIDVEALQMPRPTVISMVGERDARAAAPAAAGIDTRPAQAPTAQAPMTQASLNQASMNQAGTAQVQAAPIQAAPAQAAFAPEAAASQAVTAQAPASGHAEPATQGDLALELAAEVAAPASQGSSAQSAPQRAGNDRPFIAPAPVTPTQPQPSREAQRPAAERQAEPAPKPRLNLYERLTGGRSRAQQPAPAAAQPPRPQAVPQPVAQPRLGGLDQSDRLVPTSTEEDLLDIPAFLRRQAN